MRARIREDILSSSLDFGIFFLREKDGNIPTITKTENTQLYNTDVCTGEVLLVKRADFVLLVNPFDSITSSEIGDPYIEPIFANNAFFRVKYAAIRGNGMNLVCYSESLRNIEIKS